MIRKLKKGFTLVELVVVIAVIAILAAVSVVSYVSITKKAKESRDQQIIDEINLSLSAEEAAGRKPETMHKALEVLEANGFAPERFNSNLYSGYDLAYLLKENKFVLLTENTSTVVYPEGVSASATYELWKFTAANGDLTDGFSHYLIGEDQTGARAISTGLDVGKNTGISAVTYTGAGPAKDVVIRTNSTADAINLEINAYEAGSGEGYVCDHITHYGLAGYVKVIKGGDKSVTTGGTIGYAEVLDGKFYPINNGEVKVAVAMSEDAVIAPAEGTGTYGKTLASSKAIKDGHTGDGKVALSYPDGITDESEQSEIEAALAGEKTVAISDVTPLPEDPYANAGENDYFAILDPQGAFVRFEQTISDTDSFNDGETIVMIKDNTEIFTYVAGNKTLTLDLNGHNLDLTSQNEGIGAFSGGKLIIKDSQFDTNNRGSMVIPMFDIMETIDFPGYHMEGGEVEILSGYFRLLRDDYGNSEGTSIPPVLKGGIFNKNPSLATIPSGYHSVNNGNGTWSVVAD